MSKRFGVDLATMALGVSLFLMSCEDDEEKGKTTRADVISEEGQATLVLKEAEEKSLGIQTEPAEARKVPPSLETTAWIEPRPEAKAEVRAPVAGYFLPEAVDLTPGAPVQRGALVAHLRPVLATPDELQAMTLQVEMDREGADLERDLLRARALLEASQAQLERARKLFQDTAGSKKAIEDAELEHSSALADLKAAQEKMTTLAEKRRRILERFQAPLDGNGSASRPATGLAPIPVTSPIDGAIVSVGASQGEFVDAGRLLFELADLDKAWVRVPIFEGDIAKVDAAKPLLLSLPGKDKDHGCATLQLATRSPKVDSQRRTVDYFYEEKIGGSLRFSPGRELHLGQAVNVWVPCVGEAEEPLTVPASAVVFDSKGSSWVYVSVGERRFSRRRVDLGRVHEGRVVIARGLSAGQAVVTTGAAELLGSEFGAGEDEEK